VKSTQSYTSSYPFAWHLFLFTRTSLPGYVKPLSNYYAKASIHSNFPVACC